MELDEALEYVLAKTYMRVPWRRMGNRSAYDIFQHRVKVAANMGNIKKFIEKLCHGLHLQSISVDPEIIDFLEEHREEVLEKVREETVYWVLRAAKKAKELKTEKEEVILDEY